MRQRLVRARAGVGAAAATWERILLAWLLVGATMLPGAQPAAAASPSPARPASPASGEGWLTTLGPLGQRLWSARGRAPFRSPVVTAPTGAGPAGVLFDAAHDTVYVANNADNTLSVINAATCNARAVTGCASSAPTVAAGTTPFMLALDPSTHTLYVSDPFGGTVAVVDTATCNGGYVAGCGQSPIFIPDNLGPVLLVLDPSTHTLYVANQDSVSVIAIADCSAIKSSGCGVPLATVPLGVGFPGDGPDGLALDPLSHTLYVANQENGTVSLLGTTTCSALDTSGCSQTPPTIPVGPGNQQIAVDAAHHTAYVTIGGPSLGSVLMLDTSTCNASTTAGCASAPSTPVGSGPNWVGVDESTHTAYVLSQEDSTVSIIDTNGCNATTTQGCRVVPPVLLAAFDTLAFDLDSATGTLWVSSQSEPVVAVLDGAACNAIRTSGCRPVAPTTASGVGPQGLAVDQLTHTTYVANQGDRTVSVINAAACNAHLAIGCGQSWPTVHVGAVPQAVAVDEATDTVYVANLVDNTVSVINGATCNGTTTSGCGQTPATVGVGNFPIDLRVDETTDTIYVANIADNTVSVINGATCNGTTTSGCGQVPATVGVGIAPIALAVNAASDTVYVSNIADNTVSVINGATCNGATTSGCGTAAATMPVGNFPQAIDVDPLTHSAYVANLGDGTLSAIDTSACNGMTVTGCGQAVRGTIALGGPLVFSSVAVDRAHDTVFVSNIGDSVVDVVNGAACNASTQTGCSQTPYAIGTGGWPAIIGLDNADHTLYVGQNVDGEVAYADELAFRQP